MPNFQFIPEGHIYLLDDKELISVTQCLPKSPYMKTDKHYGDKGNYVHDMCRLYLLNDLDEDNLDPQLRPYLDALKKFLQESKGIGIVGVFDIKSGSPHPCVELQIGAYVELVNNNCPMHEGCDPFKSDMVLEEPFRHTLHLYAGTPDIIISGGNRIREGYALYLKDNGKYSLSPVKDIRKNFEIFLHHLNAYKWQKEKGLI